MRLVVGWASTGIAYSEVSLEFPNFVHGFWLTEVKQKLINARISFADESAIFQRVLNKSVRPKAAHAVARLGLQRLGVLRAMFVF